MSEQRTPQIIYDCTGTGLQPVARHRDLFGRLFAAGKRYVLIEFSERSRDSHDHYFAAMRGYWNNWPEDYYREIASADQLRKHALIQTRHYVEIIMHHASVEAAEAYVTRFRRYVDYAEGSINGATTIMRVAKTQQKKVMEAGEFQQSKQDVLDFCHAVTGIAPEVMKREATRGAAA